eukprot:scaffold25829_cov72-Phaeocystis_antarctica.AAC.1
MSRIFYTHKPTYLIPEAASSFYTLRGDRPTVLGVVCVLLGSLRVLDLAYNKLGPEGGAAVAKALKGNSTLESLK